MKKTNDTVTKVTKDNLIGKLLSEHPEVAEVLIDWGFHCIGCIAVEFDTIESGARAHGLSDDDIKELVERINEVLEYKS